MAESQKTDPPVKAKEKSSLLDIDIDKDFLGSWKSMSMGDDGIDFDFGPTTKGKQKAFNFDKMDMDFSLDAGFGNLSSFKMDMSGLDISSPTKKSGKSKENSKEVSFGGANRAKRDSFAYSFDFDEFPDLGFESKKTKIDDNSNKSNDKEGDSNANSSGGSGDFLAKDVDASKDGDISLKHPASRGVTNSEVDTQMDNIKDCDPRNEGDNVKSVIDESSLLKPANSEEQETQKTIELIPESSSSEKRDSPEPLAQKVVQDSYVRSEDINVSTECTFLEVQEESGTLIRVVSPSTGDGQNDNVRPVAELVPTRNFSAHMKSQSEKGEMCEMRDDNLIAEHIDGSDTSKTSLDLESYVTFGIENLAHKDMADKRNGDSFSKLQGDLLGSGTTTDELASDKERGNIPIRSKYFKKQNESEPELQQVSASSTKLITIGNKRTNTLPSNSASERRECGSRSLESGSTSTGLSRPLLKMLSGDIPVQTENTEASHVKRLDNTRECLNADNITSINEPTVTTMAHEEASASSTKLISIENKRMNTLPSNPTLEKRESGARSLESGSKSTGLSRSLPKTLSEDIPVQAENTEASHVKSLDNTRECLNAGNITPRNEPMVTTMAHEEASASSTKLTSIGNKRTNTLPSNPAFENRECLNVDYIRPKNERMMNTAPVPKGSDQNTEHVNAHRSDLHPSTSIEKLRKNISLNIINPGTSTHNMRKAVVKENRISPTRAEMKASEVSTLRVSRATEPKLKPLNTVLPKGLTSMRNKDQGPELQQNMVFKRNFSVDSKKQTPPTPTLKRKTFEESVDIPRLTALKRLSASPSSNSIRSSMEKVVEEQGSNHMSMASDKSPRLNVSLTEIDISSIENDGIFEMAEACSKELEDICNMLKRKHEEANDILVRAIVNNNNLLMLNHPIYQDKLHPRGSEICRVADAQVVPYLIVFSKNQNMSFKEKCLFAFGGRVIML